ncbi:MAG: polymer-forming cytoskeletal protein [Gemmatimonadales bacterium]
MAILKAKSATEPEQPAGGLSIIAVGMTVRGDLESNGTVKVEGTVEGHVQAKNQVLVAKGGVVDGDIDAREAVVGGQANGAIRALERVEIQSGAIVNGDITTRRISVAEGASLNGLIRMGEQGAGQQRPVQPQRPESKLPGGSPANPPRPPVPVARSTPPRMPAPGTGR